MVATIVGHRTKPRLGKSRNEAFVEMRVYIRSFVQLSGGCELKLSFILIVLLFIGGRPKGRKHGPTCENLKNIFKESAPRSILS